MIWPIPTFAAMSLGFLCGIVFIIGVMAIMAWIAMKQGL